MLKHKHGREQRAAEARWLKILQAVLANRGFFIYFWLGFVAVRASPPVASLFAEHGP